MKKHRSERSISEKDFKVMLDKQCDEKSQHNGVVKEINVTPRCLNKMPVKWSTRRRPYMITLHFVRILYLCKYWNRLDIKKPFSFFKGKSPGNWSSCKLEPKPHCKSDRKSEVFHLVLNHKVSHRGKKELRAGYLMSLNDEHVPFCKAYISQKSCSLVKDK